MAAQQKPTMQAVHIVYMCMFYVKKTTTDRHMILDKRFLWK